MQRLYSSQNVLEVVWIVLFWTLRTEIGHSNLSGKQLEGNLTLDATRLVQLQLLNLSSNVFRGAIPSLLGNAANLSILWVTSRSCPGSGKLFASQLYPIIISEHCWSSKRCSACGKFRNFYKSQIFSFFLRVSSRDVSNNVLRGYLPKELDSLWALSFL